ncbi:hypothetical protein MMU07_03185 [Aquiflexum sp. LQ15W]|uniref:hypothetical protein n=1 Tax=Cognataquiflexum nitidum TaxID=2922272 RepID=UPI001F147A84|nr:hypothetical protein [Cognataquiflexum nitidum]MCH6198569.1 hypothetical protein [Cognataquiflexum nitidum]
MDRNKLKALLKFVKEISTSPGNEWFRDQLIQTFHSNGVEKKSVEVDFLTDNSENLDQKVNLIRNYLALDFQNLIDYSWFEEPSREQLFRDCIEMCRFEKGTPNHKKNFGEFCRYAHLQAEEMVNYFFLKISNSDVRSVNRYLKQKNSNYSPSQEPTSIFHIPYKIKLTALKEMVTLDKKISSHLYFLNDFRNELSHRSSLSEVNDDKTLQEFEINGFLDGGYIEFNKLTKDQSKLYNDGRFIINKRKEEFYLVYEVLEELKTKISQSIIEGKSL